MTKTTGGAATGLTLGSKLLIAVLTFTSLFLANFLAYNYLLRELRTTATAVDAAGRQRMLSQKTAYLAFQAGSGHAHDRAPLKKLITEFDETLSAFKSGGYSRDFFVRAAPADILPLVKNAEAIWTPYKNAALAVCDLPAGSPVVKKHLDYIEAHSEALLSACDLVTAAFRGTAQTATRRMNQLMLLLIVLNLVLGAAFFYYAQKKIAGPLRRLDKAAAEITAGNFPDLETPASGDEVGNLFRTFSEMSRTMNRDIEKRSAIGSLLAISMEHGPLSELLDKFLENLLAIPWLAIEAKGAVFLADAGEKNLIMAASRGLSGEICSECADAPYGCCLCGRAAATGETVFATELDERHEVSYEGRKPHGHYCLPIKIRENVIGVLNLFVRAGHVYDAGERVFLEAACAIIAKAIEYKNLEAKTYEAQKMESLGKAAGAIAHDFNNILTVMQGFNSLALETLPAGGEAVKYIKETAAGIDKGGALVKQILSFSRRQPAEMASLDLNAVIEGMRIMLGMVLEKRVTLKLSLAPGLPPIVANKGQLEQVLVNLAVNARDAMSDKGGEFSVSTCEVSGDSAQAIAADLCGAPAVKLSVSDTGSGIPEEVLGHVFEPFFTTKPEGQGTGLGLSTVYSLVKLHKGGINITSSKDRGTTFNICFPADRAPAQRRV